jgi:DNA-binding transcriptional MerR regulator/methylmalonyl-CoA mutase cobalamin-binding subunit
MVINGKIETSMADSTPLYNLKAVINEVGLSPATLRAWEHRYGLLKPVRTPGGHRLYSRQDIEMLRWLVERQNEGLSISRAVEMWNRSKESKQNITQNIPATVPVSIMGVSIIDELRDQWITACMTFDDQAANHVLDQAFSIAAPETICTEVLLKGLSRIGEHWYASSATVQQEHFASAIATRRVNALMAVTVTPTRKRRILVACPPGEEHDFVLLTISYLLRRRGWDVVNLGSNVPLNDLDSTIQSTLPALIVSSAQTLNTAASLRRMSEYLITRGVPLAYGGGIFTHLPAVIQSISGYYLGGEVVSVPQMVERLVATAFPIPAVPPVSLEYSHTLTKFLQKEALILEFVSATTQVKTPNPAHLDVAIANLSQLIASALELGDINYLAQPVTWLNGLLNNHGMSISITKEILTTFSLAVEGYLGQDGAIIHNWLMQQLLSEPIRD